MELDLTAKAHTVARAALEERWSRDRFELELESEHAPQWNHLFDRSHYAASFRVFELAATARVTVGLKGAVSRVRLPYDARELADPVRSPPELTPEDEARIRLVAEDAARRAGRWQTLRSNITMFLKSDSGDPSTADAIVRVFTLVPEGLLTIDLDAETGDRLAYFAPCLLRQSRGGRPLSRREVLERVGSQGALPPDLKVGPTELEEPLGARLWRIRYDPADLERTGTHVVCAHARSGVVVGVTSTLRARVRIGRGPTRERANALVSRALPILLGPDARLGALVPGAVVTRGPARAGWVGTAVIGDGSVVRVSFTGDEVEARLGSRLLRARVSPERVTLVQPRRAGPTPVAAVSEAEALLLVGSREA